MKAYPFVLYLAITGLASPGLAMEAAKLISQACPTALSEVASEERREIILPEIHSATCDTVMGADTKINKFIRVDAFQFQYEGAMLNGYWIVVAKPSDPAGTGTGDGPTTSPKDRFKCVPSNSKVTVNGPYGWNYDFSGSELKVQGFNCVASYSKTN